MVQVAESLLLLLLLLLLASTGAVARFGQVAKLTASDAAGNDRFGTAVSLSGDTALVGADDNDDAGLSSGSAYIFERDQGGQELWGQVAKLTASDAAGNDNFGSAVSLSGDTALVGAKRDGDNGAFSGSAYIFQRNQGGPNRWGQVAKLTASDAAAGEYFGTSVSLSGDTALVGATGDDDGGPDSGSAYIFRRNQGGQNAWGQVAKLTASDAGGGDQFGSAVSLSGDMALVGASKDDDGGSGSGSAYIFQRNQGGQNVWGQVAKLTASDAAAGDWFGSAVSLSGDTALVGAKYDSDNGLGSGSAYIFQRNQGGPNRWGEVVKLTASDAARLDSFGFSVSLSGDTALVGAHGNGDGGSAYIFQRNQGKPNAWGQVLKLTASDAAGGDYFGRSVALSSDTALLGADGSDDDGDSSGSAYIFKVVPTTAPTAAPTATPSTAPTAVPTTTAAQTAAPTAAPMTAPSTTAAPSTTPTTTLAQTAAPTTTAAQTAAPTAAPAEGLESMVVGAIAAGSILGAGALLCGGIVLRRKRNQQASLAPQAAPTC